MYNRETFEYREIDYYDYLKYKENANYLLTVISEHASLPVSEITYEEVINFFIEKFDIEIIYFDYREKIENFEESYINNTISEVSPTFLKRVSGFTITDGIRYKIFLQRYSRKQRVLFTLLHELVHIYFHCVESEYKQIFASIETQGHYPEEILPFEDEANVIGSLLYLNDKKLVQYIDEGYSFDRIMTIHNISKSALHCRINNYLIYELKVEPRTAFFNYLLPYKEEVYGQQSLERLQLLMSSPKFFSRQHEHTF